MIKTVFPGNLGHSDVFSEEIAQKAADAGFSGYWFNPTQDFTMDHISISNILRRFDLTPSGMELPVEFRKDESSFNQDLEKLKSIASFAEQVGITRTVTWIVPAHDELSFNENFDLHSTRLRRIADILDDYGISLGLEFQGPKSLRKDKKHWFIHSIDGVKALRSSIGRNNCGVLLDVWHWDLAGMTDFDFNQISADEIICVHLNDAPLVNDEMEYQDLVRELPGKTGVLKIKNFIDGLKALKYEGPVMAEPFDATLANMNIESAFKIVSESLDKVL